MKSPGLSIVMMGPKLKGKAPPAPASEPDADDTAPSKEEVAAFSELLAAVKSGDASTGALALKNFLKECEY